MLFRWTDAGGRFTKHRHAKTCLAETRVPAVALAVMREKLLSHAYLFLSLECLSTNYFVHNPSRAQLGKVLRGGETRHSFI